MMLVNGASIWNGVDRKWSELLIFRRFVDAKFLRNVMTVETVRVQTTNDSDQVTQTMFGDRVVAGVSRGSRKG